MKPQDINVEIPMDTRTAIRTGTRVSTRMVIRETTTIQQEMDIRTSNHQNKKSS